MGTKFYKHPQYSFIYGLDIVTPPGRLIYPSLVKPKDAPPAKDGEQQGKPRYEVSILLDRKLPTVQAFLSQVKDMTDAMLVQFNEKRNNPLGAGRITQDGDDNAKFPADKYPHHAGHEVICARNQKAVQFVGSTKGEDGNFITLDPKDVVGGVIGRLRVCPLITAHGVSYKLIAGQVTKDDGERFCGGFRDATDMFDACEPETKGDEPASIESIEPIKEQKPAAQKFDDPKDEAISLL